MCIMLFMRTLAIILALLSPALAHARSERQGHIPNGSVFSCDSCHGKASLKPADLTPFGVDVNRNLSNGVVQWQNIWMLDSDSDGFSNGLELNDPTGVWLRGQPDPGGPVSNPGAPNQGICGNGVVEPDEDCETLGDHTCRSMGLGDGTLECRQCRWYTFFCGTCGDKVLNPLKEDCDFDQFGDNTCASFGFRAGDLSCTSDCKIDSSDCNDEAAAICGDGILSRDEQCDGDLFGTVDCARLNYAGGTLKCTAGCKWDATECIPKDYTPSERPDADEASSYDAANEDPDASNDDLYNRDGLSEAGGCSSISGGLFGLLLLPVFLRRQS